MPKKTLKERVLIQTRMKNMEAVPMPKYVMTEGGFIDTYEEIYGTEDVYFSFVLEIIPENFKPAKQCNVESNMRVFTREDVKDASKFTQINVESTFSILNKGRTKEAVFFFSYSYEAPFTLDNTRNLYKNFLTVKESEPKQKGEIQRATVIVYSIKIINTEPIPDEELIALFTPPPETNKTNKKKTKKTSNKTVKETPEEAPVEAPVEAEEAPVEAPVEAPEEAVEAESSSDTSSDTGDPEVIVRSNADAIIDSSGGHCGYITFNRYVQRNPFAPEDKTYIMSLLRDAFAKYPAFMHELKTYSKLQIIKNLHYDVATIPETLHINAQFWNSRARDLSPTYHLYIREKTIYTATNRINGKTIVLF